MKKLIPGTVDELRGLLTAREWEKAAYVWAFCTNENKGGRPSKEMRGRPHFSKFAFSEFARIGITGLRDAKTVSQYWRAWQDVIDAGQALPVEPGKEFDVPDLPWSEIETRNHRHNRPRLVKPGERRGSSPDLVDLPKRDAESLILGMLDDLNHFGLLRVQIKINAIMSVRAHQDQAADTK